MDIKEKWDAFMIWCKEPVVWARGLSLALIALLFIQAFALWLT